MIAHVKERITISIDAEALAGVREDVDEGAAPNLSAAIEAALRSQGRMRALDRLLDDFAARHPDKPLTDAEQAWARDALGNRGTAGG
jgi:hypothetical protein